MEDEDEIIIGEGIEGIDEENELEGEGKKVIMMEKEGEK